MNQKSEENLIEDCPVCKQHTFQWSWGGLGVTCTNCGWYPISIPWDKEDEEKAINKYNTK